jgi:hypothetical protein
MCECDTVASLIKSAWSAVEAQPGNDVTVQELQRTVGWRYPQSTQSAGPVRFLIFCSISISLLASLVAGRRSQCNVGAN